jgi:hypothetical protein
MKKFVAILILSTGIAFFSKAQTPEEKRAQKTIESKDFAALKLTDDQKTKIVAILATQNKSLDSLFNTHPGNNRGSLQVEIEYPNDAKILDLLNENQKKLYSAYARERITRTLSKPEPVAEQQPQQSRSSGGGRRR